MPRFRRRLQNVSAHVAKLNIVSLTLRFSDGRVAQLLKGEARVPESISLA
jgi:hypothetical protein